MTIATASVGQKDLTKGLFDVWESVFTLHQVRKVLSRSLEWRIHDRRVVASVIVFASLR